MAYSASSERCRCLPPYARTSSMVHSAWSACPSKWSLRDSFVKEVAARVVGVQGCKPALRRLHDSTIPLLEACLTRSHGHPTDSQSTRPLNVAPSLKILLYFSSCPPTALHQKFLSTHQENNGVQSDKPSTRKTPQLSCHRAYHVPSWLFLPAYPTAWAISPIWSSLWPEPHLCGAVLAFALQLTFVLIF